MISSIHTLKTTFKWEAASKWRLLLAITLCLTAFSFTSKADDSGLTNITKTDADFCDLQLSLNSKGLNPLDIYGSSSFISEIYPRQTSITNTIDPNIPVSFSGYFPYLAAYNGNSLGGDYYSIHDGVFIEYENGTAVFKGRLVNNDHGNADFDIHLDLSGRTTTPPPNSPKNDIGANTSDWVYYSNFSGKIIGNGYFEGAELSLTPKESAFQIGTGANAKSISEYGGSMWMYSQIVSQPYNTAHTVQAYQANDINFQLNIPSNQCSVSNSIDPNTAVSFTGYFPYLAAYNGNSLGGNYFSIHDGIFSEGPNGTAIFTGRLVNNDHGNADFDIQLNLSGRTKIPPAGNPKNQLSANTSDWYYYPNFSGTITGNGYFEGAELSLTPQGPSFQVGTGANDQQTNQNGGSMWLVSHVVSQPNNTAHTVQAHSANDINFQLTCPSNVEYVISDQCGFPRSCTASNTTDPEVNNVSFTGYFPHLAAYDGNYIFGEYYSVQDGTFTENSDGTAHFTGRLVANDHGNGDFDISIDLSGRTTTPPAGSPKNEISANTSDWYYYPNFSGTLTGNGYFEGAKLNLTAKGPSFQVGTGANDQQIHQNGGSMWLVSHIVSQPNNTAHTVQAYSANDINFQLSCSSSVGQNIPELECEYYTPTTTWVNGDCNPQIQSGESITLSILPNEFASYSWTGPNGFSSTSEDITISNATIAQSGTYTVVVTNAGGCTAIKSITLSLNSNSCNDVLVGWDLDACQAYSDAYSFSEFTPTYSTDSNCESISATTVYRDNPDTYYHSCLAGQEGNAMCISGTHVDYVPDNSVHTLKFSATLNAGTTIGSLSFYQKSEEHIVNNGQSIIIINNYLKKYSVRAKINGLIVFQSDNNYTSQSDWSLAEFNFSSISQFQLTSTTTVDFELVAYDPVGNNTDVRAWEIDEIKINGCCAPLTASIGDFVFNDINGNGIQESGEFGLPGVTVMLLDGNGNMVAQKQTDNDGKYKFNDLDTGDYKVKFPATGSTSAFNYILTQPNQGTNDGTDSDPVVMQGTNDAMTEVITVIAGDDIINVDAGYFIGSKITGVTWEDQNLNGIQDLNESNINGVTVMLLDENGNMVGQTTTTANGTYTFDNLAPGDYKVKFPVTPTVGTINYDLTDANQGSDDDTDSDAIPMNDGSGNAMTQIVSVENGQTVDNLDAGYFALVTIGDKVFEDKNANGIQDAGESGIDGVTVMLLDANGDMVGQAQTTANGGAYDFTNVAPGTYKVKFTAPTQNGVTAILTDAGQGTDESKDSDAVAMANSDDAMTEFVTVTAGDDENDLDAGYYFPAKLGNFVFEDTNENGIQDLGENGIDGVTVMLLDANGDMITSVETANGGLYEFAGLAPGTYKVKFPQAATTNAGTVADLTSPNQGANDAADSDAIPMPGTTDAMSQLVTLESGDNDDTIDAGYVPGKASIGDVVFEDKNANGLQDDNEPGIDGVIVMLLDANGDMVGQAQTTANGGTYDFTNLAPGTYKVKFTAPTIGAVTAILTDADEGNDDTKDSDAVTMPGTDDAMTELVTVVANDDIDDVDAGYYFPAKLGNYVWEDADLDGIQDAGEGIEGVPVELRDTAGNTLDDTTTDANGLYEFAGLKPGDYKVVFPTQVNVAGKDIILTKANQGGDDTKDSDAVAMAVVNEAMSQVVTLESGDNDDTIDAGYIAAATLGDKAFIDENQNGLQDNTDGPLAGVTVTLTGTDIFGNDVSATQTTDDNGEYLFTMLVPGTYEVQFSQPATYVITRKDEFGNGFDFADSDISPLTGKSDLITLGSGEDNRSIDAGFFIDPALPVALTSFEAQLINNSEVVLKWATASEEDNSHFVVERSLDGKEFESIGVVEGNGTTNQVNTYALVDADPAYGYNYYRLKQVDFDGDYEFSQVETVIISSQDVPDVILYPNPVVKTTTLRVVTPFETDASIEVVDFSGKVLLNVVMAKGANSKQLDLSGFAAGTYFAYVNYNGHRELVHKVIKVEE